MRKSLVALVCLLALSGCSSTERFEQSPCACDYRPLDVVQV
ncbi:lipoprotein [Budviciaceae bacterium CWB-B4]|uniref:Type IV secretion system putative lipoprotein virB7 n=1 Tax=Limnobaculum xujianqingii TaxID=2738837 RepID=A0A9D7FVP3_9GAMM|nr:lipoprotein [Limnobaculum xujianqingii]MBK5174921.1 lipoprotein [Limnobaculum xujianqingii]